MGYLKLKCSAFFMRLQSEGTNSMCRLDMHPETLLNKNEARFIICPHHNFESFMLPAPLIHHPKLHHLRWAHVSPARASSWTKEQVCAHNICTNMLPTLLLITTTCYIKSCTKSWFRFPFKVTIEDTTILFIYSRRTTNTENYFFNSYTQSRLSLLSEKK